MAELTSCSYGMPSEHAARRQRRTQWDDWLGMTRPLPPCLGHVIKSFARRQLHAVRLACKCVGWGGAVCPAKLGPGRDRRLMLGAWKGWPSLLSTGLPLPLRLSQQTRHIRTGLHSVLLRHCALALGQLADGQRHVSIMRHLQYSAWGQQPRWQRWQVRPCTPSLGGITGDAQVQAWRAVPLPEAAGFSSSCQLDVQKRCASHPGWSLSQAWYAHACLQHKGRVVVRGVHVEHGLACCGSAAACLVDCMPGMWGRARGRGGAGQPATLLLRSMHSMAHHALPLASRRRLARGGVHACMHACLLMVRLILI